MQKIFGSKHVFDWLVAHGHFDEVAMECMQAERRKPRAPRAGPEHCAIKHARFLRKQASYVMRWKTRACMWDAGHGKCEQCTWEERGKEKLRLCGLCKLRVCHYCAVDEHSLCKQCDRGPSSRDAMVPRRMPAEQRAPVGCDYCGVGELAGACYLCGRFLCDDCRLDQAVVTCVQCPEVHAAMGGLKGLSLRMNQVRKPGSSFEKLVTTDPAHMDAHARSHSIAANHGRLARWGAYTDGSRTYHRGAAWQASQAWQQRQRGGPDHPDDAPPE